MDAEDDAFRARLKLARERSGLTQAQLAAMAHVAVNTLKQYESGRIKPGADALAGYARAGINVRYLLLGEGEALMVDQALREAPRVGLHLDEPHQGRGDIAVAQVVAAMMSILHEIGHQEQVCGVELTAPKRQTVAQSLFEEFLETGSLPRTGTVHRFVKAAG